MPPKVSSKADAKAKQKALEDKTFGLKNKNKSSKVNQYIQTLEQQIKHPQGKAAKVLSIN